MGRVEHWEGWSIRKWGALGGVEHWEGGALGGWSIGRGRALERGSINWEGQSIGRVEHWEGEALGGVEHWDPCKCSTPPFPMLQYFPLPMPQHWEHWEGWSIAKCSTSPSNAPPRSQCSNTPLSQCHLSLPMLPLPNAPPPQCSPSQCYQPSQLMLPFFLKIIDSVLFSTLFRVLF